MPGGPFYLLDQPHPLNSNWGTLQDAGSAPSQATTGTGWTVGTTAPTMYSNMNYGGIKAASSFGSSALPTGSAANNVWCSQYPLSGTYPAGNWTFTFSFLANGATLDGTGNLNLRMGVSPQALSGNVTNVLAMTATASVSVLTTATLQTVTATVSMPALVMDQQYLLLPVAWEITGASSSSSSGVVFVQGYVPPGGPNPPQSAIFPTTFVPAPPSGIITAGSGSNNMGSVADPMYPVRGDLDSYLPPQQELVIGTASASGINRSRKTYSGGPATVIGANPRNQTTVGGIVHTGGSPNDARGTANQLSVGITSPVQLPFVAELPPAQSLDNGRSLGVTGGYSGQISTGFGIPAEIGVITYGVPPPPYVDLPPAQELPSLTDRKASGVGAGKPILGGYTSLSLGAGLFVAPGTIVDNVFLPPTVPELPPAQALLQNFNRGATGTNNGGGRTAIGGFNAISMGGGHFVLPGSIIDNIELPPTADLPPQDYLYAGFGLPAETGQILDNIELPPTADFPPQDYVSSGFNLPAPPPIYGGPAPALAELPPFQTFTSGGVSRIVGGFAGQVAHGAGGLRRGGLTVTGSLGTVYAFASTGKASGFMSPGGRIVAAPADYVGLAPQSYVLAGFGEPAQTGVILDNIELPPTVGLPPQDCLASGFGQAAQAPVIVRQDLLPPTADLPPDQYWFAGHGQAAQPPVIVSDVLSLGAPFAGLPPLDYHPAGHGLPSEVATIAQAPLVPPSAILPPSALLSAGHGAYVGPAEIIEAKVLPLVPELPPRTIIEAGVVPSTTGTITRAPIVLELAQLPPTTVIEPGVPAKTGTPILFHVGTLPPFVPELPPKALVLVGFGEPAQSAVIYASQPAPVAELPPRPETFSGFGQASSVGSIVQAFLLPPTADLPPPSIWTQGHGQQSEPVYIYARVTPLYYSVEVTPLDPTAKVWPLYVIEVESTPVGPDIVVTARVLDPNG
jgi:hypothetical protein